MERQHLSAVSRTKECLHSVVCRVPLIDGAKVGLINKSTFFCCQLWIIVQLNYMFVIGGHTISYLHSWKCGRFHSFYQTNVNLSCTLGRQPLFKPCYIIVLCYLLLLLLWLNFKLLLQQAEKTVVLLSKLAKVVAQEKLVLEHCLELLRTISALEVRYKH